MKGICFKELETRVKIKLNNNTLLEETSSIYIETNLINGF